MNSCNTVIICAELTELAPFVNRTWLQECLAHRFEDSCQPPDPEKVFPTPGRELSGLRFYSLDLPEIPGKTLGVQSGVGMVNAARTTAIAIEVLGARQVLYSGTAGGLAKDSQVGEVVFGDNYVFHSADATAFGYQRGQLPGMPPSYAGNERLLASARSLLTASDKKDSSTATGAVTFKNPIFTAETELSYESSDPTVATVDPKTGAITALKPGTTQIIIRAAQSDLYKEAVRSSGCSDRTAQGRQLLSTVFFPF